MTPNLDSLRVASPCPANWEDMKGDERVRFCDLCHLNVYNFAELTRKELDALIANTEGGLCGRLYRRADGTVITKDCPFRLQAIRRRVATLSGAIFATLMSAISVFGQKQSGSTQSWPRQVTISRQAPDSPDKAGSLSGKIFDQNGASIRKAKVTLIEHILNSSITRESNEFGEFLIPHVTTGTYDIVIEAGGFKTFRKRNVPLSSDEMANLNVVLTISTGMLTGFVATGPSLIDRPAPSTTIIR